MPDALQELITQLEATAKRVRELEHQAKTALYSHNYTKAHRDQMLAKAALLQALPDDYAPILAACASSYPQQAAMAGEALEGFAQGAANAVKLDSIFYMSALLYPDEHKDGEPNNLERLIAELKGAPHRHGLAMGLPRL